MPLSDDFDMEDIEPQGPPIRIVEELDQKYPDRPRNHGETFPFHDLFLTLFNPLNENKKKPTGPIPWRRKVGPHGPAGMSPHEARRAIIERFVSRWRRDVGNDIYPAFRLIVPEKDRDRPMYGLKEKAIGKLLVKVMKIDKNSEDGFALLNWKLPGQTTASRLAGDFAGRCFEVISKRPMRIEVGNMLISEVNDILDNLSAATKEAEQLPILEELYDRMNAEELMWLIRIILRQMKVGATEKTLFDIWHPDAESLFNVSSSLRRVCWELYDQRVRLEGEDRGVTLMQCFQPQLAQFQIHSFQKMVERMRPTQEDQAFWIEEKLDGERMQMHMMEDVDTPGGMRFGFWSRKAKEYTYLYGSGFLDNEGALTQHIRGAFHDGVRNIILDGEMITWDPEQDAMVPFGTLKTAALSEQRNPFSGGIRPLFRVFDCLYLNGTCLTNYTLRDRRKALEASVKSIHRRLEIHGYEEAFTAEAIEPLLRQVVAEASEGLILKNPRAMYRLNERVDDWMKVKPEYMTEFGESLDCIVIGGYYGSGRRGGTISSFLCGLRVAGNESQSRANPMKCYSFFRVGGGFTAADYAAIRHQTDSKWKEWDPKCPPTDYIELAGGNLQCERPDVWIRPDESVVLSVKAAQVTQSDQFRVGLSLRFPRFSRLRMDRSWDSALSLSDFMALKADAEKERKEKEFEFEHRRKRVKKSTKKALTVLGNEEAEDAVFAGPHTNVFEGLNFFIITEALGPPKRTKAEVEKIVKAHGGRIYQSHDAVSDILCIADRRVVKAASLQKAGETDIIRSTWLFSCIAQAEKDIGRPTFLLPLEPDHLSFATPKTLEQAYKEVDEYNDSYSRDVTIEELQKIFSSMDFKPSPSFSAAEFKSQLEDHNPSMNLGNLPGSIFSGLVVYVEDCSSEALVVEPQGEAPHPNRTSPDVDIIRNMLEFGGARLADEILENLEVTHVVVGEFDGTSASRQRVLSQRQRLAGRPKLPRWVTRAWVEQSFKERTRLDEERERTRPPKPLSFNAI
ncbi:MAG: DNA ligase (ATP) [Vezdaea acicularis]|nr:MAG: DNA ligase (ATP) [Vezdaea acicularis]